MGGLCLLLNFVFPTKFKPLECEKYDGMTLPILHLIMYMPGITAHINNEKLMVYYF